MAKWEFDGRIWFEETDAGYLPIDARVSGQANGEKLGDSLTRALVRWLGIHQDMDDGRIYCMAEDAEGRPYKVRIVIEIDEGDSDA